MTATPTSAGLFASLLAAAALMLTGCGQPQPAPASDAPPVEGEAANTQSSGRLNLYSARHYDADDAIYEAFEAETGIALRVLEAGGDLLLERLRTEGEASPADVIITVDAGRLWRAKNAGVFQPLETDAILAATPARVRDPDNHWFGIAKRVRVHVIAPDRIDAAEVDTYEALANPELEGRVCARTSANIYNLSLLAGLIERWGPDRAEAWATGVGRNLARPPQGGDTDQIRAVAAGECDVALVNHYYWARLANSGSEADQAVAAATQIVWPDQDGAGAHANISGVGLAANAPNKDNAVRFIEYLLRPAVQSQLGQSNNEFPVNPAASLDNPVLEALGAPVEEDINVSVYGGNQAEALAMFDRAGWP